MNNKAIYETASGNTEYFRIPHILQSHSPKKGDSKWGQMTEKSLTPNAFAKLHCIGREKVMRWIKSGRLGAIDVADEGSTWPRYRIPVEAHEDFIKASTVIPAEPPPAKLSPVKRGIRRRQRSRPRRQAASVQGHNSPKSNGDSPFWKSHSRT